jgi:hypothetical protein
MHIATSVHCCCISSSVVRQRTFGGSLCMLVTLSFGVYLAAVSTRHILHGAWCLHALAQHAPHNASVIVGRESHLLQAASCYFEA